jgi:excisionase family DNA binding protein
MSRRKSDTSGLFVRLPRDAAERLDRAAFETGTAKRELVTRLVMRHLDAAAGEPARVPFPHDAERDLQVGRHSFRPASDLEVLTLAQVAQLLDVEEDAVRELAEAGDLPGRRIGEQWRFARAAVLDWLRGQDA